MNERSRFIHADDSWLHLISFQDSLDYFGEELKSGIFILFAFHTCLANLFSALFRWGFWVRHQ